MQQIKNIVKGPYEPQDNTVIWIDTSNLGIDPYSEKYQYLAGEVGKRMFKVAKKFLCDHCKQYIL